MPSNPRRNVPKKVLVSVMEIVFEKDLLKIASAIGRADLMREELRQFERWSTKGGHVKFGARAGHDDLVMALVGLLVGLDEPTSCVVGAGGEGAGLGAEVGRNARLMASSEDGLVCIT